MCRTALGVSVNDVGSIFFWCARARWLVYSAAQRARRVISSLAQWQRPRMWIYVAAPQHTTKPSWGGDAHAGLKRPTRGLVKAKFPQKKLLQKNQTSTGGVVRSRSTRPRRRSSNRSWTGSWSAPRILQLQRASVVALRFFAPFSRVFSKEQNTPPPVGFFFWLPMGAVSTKINCDSASLI